MYVLDVSIPTAPAWVRWCRDSETRYQVLTMSVTVWLAEWSQQTKKEQERTRYVTVLILLTLATTVVSFFRDTITFASLIKVCAGAVA